MPLTRQQKAALVDNITEQIEGASYIYLTDFQGLTVEQTNELRSRFRASGVQYRVLKNTMVRLALERIGGYDALMEHLSGPTAVALSDEPAAPARVIKKFLSDEDVERPELKVAFVDGDIYPGDQLDVLAALKSRDELVGDILGLLQSPMANVLGALESTAGTLAGIVKARAERDEEDEE